jgi:hypothetical protein
MLSRHPFLPTCGNVQHGSSHGQSGVSGNKAGFIANPVLWQQAIVGPLCPYVECGLGAGMEMTASPLFRQLPLVFRELVSPSHRLPFVSWTSLVRPRQFPFVPPASVVSFSIWLLGAVILKVANAPTAPTPMLSVASSCSWRGTAVSGCFGACLAESGGRLDS